MPGTSGIIALANVVFIGAAVAALLWIYRLVIVGFLQGMLWLAVTYLAFNIGLASQLHLLSGRLGAAYWVGVPVGCWESLEQYSCWCLGAQLRTGATLGGFAG